MNPNRPKVWAEDVVNDPRGDEMMAALGESERSHVVDEVSKRGLVCLGNCMKCGRQWKMVVPWGEIAAMFLGQPLAGTKATRQGVLLGVGCRCNAPTPMRITWPEIKQYVEIGVQSGSLDARIFEAAKSPR